MYGKYILQEQCMYVWYIYIYIYMNQECIVTCLPRPLDPFYKLHRQHSS